MVGRVSLEARTQPPQPPAGTPLPCPQVLVCTLPPALHKARQLVVVGSGSCRREATPPQHLVLMALQACPPGLGLALQVAAVAVACRVPQPLVATRPAPRMGHRVQVPGCMGTGLATPVNHSTQPVVLRQQALLCRLLQLGPPVTLSHPWRRGYPCLSGADGKRPRQIGSTPVRSPYPASLHRWTLQEVTVPRRDVDSCHVGSPGGARQLPLGRPPLLLHQAWA